LQTREFLTLEDILRIHQRQIERFGGTPGIRDVNLLESALAQPQAIFSGDLLHKGNWAKRIWQFTLSNLRQVAFEERKAIAPNCKLLSDV